MTRHTFHSILFLAGLAGLAVICWIGAGYVGSNALGVAVTLVIGACYATGGLELLRYRQATATLARARSTTPRRMTGWAAGSSACIRACAKRCACAWKASAWPCRRRR